AELAEKPLLYVPLARGGDARKVAQARGLQQFLRELLRRLPRLGLVRQTCQLLRVARTMETKHSPGAGAVTEFDRLFEAGFTAIGECLAEPSRRSEQPSRRQTTGRSRRLRPAASDPADDSQLIDCLEEVTQSLLTEWLSHSRTLRLSVLERLGSN